MHFYANISQKCLQFNDYVHIRSNYFQKCEQIFDICYFTDSRKILETCDIPITCAEITKGKNMNKTKQKLNTQNRTEIEQKSWKYNMTETSLRSTCHILDL